MSIDAEAPLAGRRVLIVEDRYLIACDLADEVRELGAEVVGPSGNLAQALELVERESVDLALLDVNLDGDPVFPIAERLDAKGVPLIFLTGYDCDVMPESWRARPRLSKPVDAHELRAELARTGAAPA
jgi:DNA-binding response OmpR family regulator